MKNELPSLLSSGQRFRFLFFGAIYVAIWVGAWYSASLLDRLGAVSLWFLPAGLRFFSLLALGRRGVLLEVAVQLVFALMQLTHVEGSAIAEILSTNTLWRLYNLFASLLTSIAIIFPLRRRLLGQLDFARPRYSALFIAASLAVSALSALIGTIGLLHLGVITEGQEAEVIAGWLIGDFIGIVTLAPFLLVRVWPYLRRFILEGAWHGQHGLGAVGRRADRNTILVVLLALAVVFAIPWALDLNAQFPLIALLLLLPLVGVALQYGLRGAALAVLLLDCGLVVLIAVFHHKGQAQHYQIVMMAIAFVGIWLGGVVETRNRLMARYRDFASVSNDLLWETDRRGVLIETSGRLLEQVALAPGLHWKSFFAQKDQAPFATLKQSLAQHLPFRNAEFELPAAGENSRWIQLNGLPLSDESGELTGYRGTAVDVSLARRAEELLRNYNETLLAEVAERTRELRRSNDELATKEQHLEVLLAAAPVGVLEFDSTQRCHFINVNGCALTGCTPEQARGRHLFDFVHPDDRAYVEFVWKMNHQSAQVQWLEFRLSQTDLRCAAHWINLSHTDGATDGMVVVLTNTTARSRQDERLWTLAHYDALTELPNRNLFWDRIGQALHHAKRRENGAALLWIDLDGFKAVNDSLGHAAGDSLLQQVAQRLKSRTRDSDTVARIGGDEFAVIMPDITEAESAVQVASELVVRMAEPFYLPQGTVNISCSIGVALYPQDAQTVDALTQCADMAMYTAKKTGKNQVRVWRKQ